MKRRWWIPSIVVPWIELLVLGISALLLLPLVPTVLPQTWARFTQQRIVCFHCRADGCDRSELEHVCAVYRPPVREDPVLALKADVKGWLGSSPQPPPQDDFARYFATSNTNTSTGTSSVIYYPSGRTVQGSPTRTGRTTTGGFGLSSDGNWVDDGGYWVPYDPELHGDRPAGE